MLTRWPFLRVSGHLTREVLKLDGKPQSAIPRWTINSILHRYYYGKRIIQKL
jgi:hypothetical protein